MKNSISYYQLHDKIFKMNKDFYFERKNHKVPLYSAKSVPLTSDDVLNCVRNEGYKEYFINGYKVLAKNIFYVF